MPDLGRSAAHFFLVSDIQPNANHEKSQGCNEKFFNELIEITFDFLV
jgi:hypothetical protein